MIVIVECDSAFCHPSIFFDEHFLRPIDHYFAYIGVIEQGLNRTKSCELIKDLLEEMHAHVLRQIYLGLCIHFIQSFLDDRCAVAQLQSLAFH
jgi:hypothetical protein